MKRLFLLLTVLLIFVIPENLYATEAWPEASGLWTCDETLLVIGGLAGAGVLTVYDEEIRGEADEHRRPGLSRLSDGFDLLGSPFVTLGVSGVLYGTGRVRDDAGLAQTGRLSVQAVLIAQAATVALKAGVGRERPDDADDAWSFRPLGIEEDHNSFPSAHTSGAFALAAVLARRTEHPRAAWLYYGLASLVALSRVYDEEHWASDVAVGALVGELSGRLVVRAAGDEEGWLLGAMPTPDGGALLALSGRW